MTDLVTDEAVKTAIAALDDNPHWATDLAMVQVVLTAAAPHIAEQATADLRARIEALRDECGRSEYKPWLTEQANIGGALARADVGAALDALLREGE